LGLLTIRFIFCYILTTHCSVRALGETDLNPVSGLGKISQLFFAAIQPGNVVANIIAGGVAEAGAQQYAFHLWPCLIDLMDNTEQPI
jgi:hypothetical protein